MLDALGEAEGLQNRVKFSTWFTLFWIAKTVRDSEIVTEAQKHTQNQNGCVSKQYISEKIKHVHARTYLFSRLQDSIWCLHRRDRLTGIFPRCLLSEIPLYLSPRKTENNNSEKVWQKQRKHPLFTWMIHSELATLSRDPNTAWYIELQRKHIGYFYYPQWDLWGWHRPSLKESILCKRAQSVNTEKTFQSYFHTFNFFHGNAVLEGNLKCKCKRWAV